MKRKLLLNHAPLSLPNLNVLEISPPALSDAFRRAGKILHHQLEQLHTATAAFADFRPAPWNWVLLSLLAQVNSNYHAYIYLELHHDRTGSQLLLERLQEAAITLIYLLEEADTTLLFEYLAASVPPARELLQQVTAQLQQLPQQPELLRLKAQLETFIEQYEALTVAERQTAPAPSSNWGPPGAQTTSQRAVRLGLHFLINPTRQLALTVRPASGLELQLQSVLNASDRDQWLTASEMNFTELRDAAHLCLHVAQTWLTEVGSYLEISVTAIERQQRWLTQLYEWFYQAHAISQLQWSQKFLPSSFTNQQS
jgi:hypothetical protein